VVGPAFLKLLPAITACLHTQAAADPPPPVRHAPLEAASVAEPSQVFTKETAPVRVAFVEHSGPYWTTGPIVEQVRDAMRELGETGPLFLRLPDSAHGTGDGSGRNEIGFVLQGTREPKAPFRVERRSGRLVAYILAPGPFGTTARHHTTLSRWAGENGFESTGSFTELYWIGRKPFDREIVEIQMDVRKQSGAPPPPSPSAPTIATESTDPRQAHEAAQPVVAQDKPAAPLESATPPSETDRDSGPASGPGPPALDGPPSIEALYQQGEWPAIAERLLPLHAIHDAGARAWLEQFVLRLSALSRGLERDGSTPAVAIRHMSDHIRRRFDENAGGVAAVNFSGSTASVSPKHRAIMMELDRLLGRVAMEAVEPMELERQCVGLVTRVAELNSRGSGPPSE